MADEDKESGRGGGPARVAPTPPKRLIVWSITRSRSTALERAFLQRSDAVVAHEEFTEAGGRRHPDAEAVMARASTCPITAPRACYVTKEMASFAPLHVPDQKLHPWLARFEHVILVRRPLDSLASLKRVGTQDKSGRTYFDPESEAGFKEAFLLRRRIFDAFGGVDAAVVVDADDDLMANPRGTLAAMCARLAIPFEESMLTWESGPVPLWAKLQGWHDDAQASNGFQAPDMSVDFRGDEEVVAAARVCEPFYKALRAPFAADAYAELVP